jgi:hypothetical protein
LLYRDPNQRSPHLAVLCRFEHSEEQGEADKTGKLSENQRFFDK